MGIPSFAPLLPGADHQLLPRGIHPADWGEVVSRFRWTARRIELLEGLFRAAWNLHRAGCLRLYLDGSFVTSKDEPNDYDAAWDPQGVDHTQLDPVFLDFSQKRRRQKDTYSGEFFPSGWPADARYRTFLEFFQEDRFGNPKGIVLLDLLSLPVSFNLIP